MKAYEYILFDLDGTLTDSGPGIRNSVAYALERFGIEVKEEAELNRFIGPPLLDSFKSYYNFSDDEANRALKHYRTYYSEKGIFENTLYGGIKALLAELYAKDKKVILATSKPEFFARQILDYFDVTKYFFFIAGSTMDETRTKKEEVIAYALEKCQIQDKGLALMVGDREHDIIGAKANGLDTVGVLFGYGSEEELMTAGATYIAETVKDLSHLLLENQ